MNKKKGKSSALKKEKDGSEQPKSSNQPSQKDTEKSQEKNSPKHKKFKSKKPGTSGKAKNEQEASQRSSQEQKAEPGQVPPQGPQPRGPPPFGTSQQEQVPPQGAWSRGPPPGSSQQGQVPPQGPQSAGPPPFGTSQQGQVPPQGAWSRGPPPGSSQQGQVPPQGAWSRGPPPGSSQQGQVPPQGSQPAGPPPFGTSQQGQVPPQGAWSRGPPPGSSQQGQVPPQGAWPRGPPPGSSQQGQVPPQGAWPRGPPPGTIQQQEQSSVHKSSISSTKSTHSIKKSDADSKAKEVISSEEKKDFHSIALENLEIYNKFAPRIYAPKKTGRPITVSTNHFQLMISNPDISVYHYDVTIEPDKPKNLLRSVWKNFMLKKFPQRLAPFDGKNAFSRGALMQEPSCSAIVKIQNDNKEREFHVTIKEVRRVSLSALVNFKEKVRQSSSMKAYPEAEISVLEIILKDWACDNYLRVRRSFFSKSSAGSDISPNLELRFGYFQSAYLGYKPYLNFDVSHKAFYKRHSLLEVVNNFRNPRTKMLNFEGLNHFLKTVKVDYQLPGDPTIRTYRVNKLVDNALNQSFLIDEKTKISVAKFFETEKKYKLRYPDLPLLWVGPVQKTIYLPMEFCKIAPDQVCKAVLDSSETRQMVKLATTNAKIRQEKVFQAFDKIRFNELPMLKEFGIKVSNEMERVNGRILDPPNLKTSQNINVKNGVWRINDFFEPKTLKKWCILNLDKRVRKENIILLENLIKRKGNEFRMQILDPIKAPIDSDSSFTGLKKAFSQLKDMEMVLVIITEDKGVYSRVKVITETQEGILTQCVKGRTVLQDPGKLQTTVQNILLKINAKLGGKNYCLDPRSVPPCLLGHVMVIGADVTHSSPGLKIPSVAAVTVSCDPEAFQYSGSIKIQPKGEIIKGLQEIITDHVKRFYEIRKHYPEKIIFFRDGVSEGELPKVFKEELKAVSYACSKFCNPKITFIIVQKRHNTRFFLTSEKDVSDKNFNVPVGTCIDSDIVHPRDLDFYLVSHASILGCARPTRYRAIYDDNKLNDDEIERLAFYLCHLFSRCTRSVSYPSPTYNAHLAAARVRAYLEGLKFTEDSNLEDIQKKMPDLISKKFPMFFV